MRHYDSNVIDALGQPRGVSCQLIWMEARNRSTGAIEGVGFWTGRRNITVEVIDGFTQQLEERSFYGTNGLLSIGDIEWVADLSIRELRIGLAPLASEVINILRTYNPKGQKFQLYTGFQNTDDRSFIEPPRADFIGFTDRNPITLATDDRSEATLVVISQTRELTRINPATRSNEWLHTRDPNDDFYKYTPDAHQWTMYWGKEGNPGNNNNNRKRY